MLDHEARQGVAVKMPGQGVGELLRREGSGAVVSWAGREAWVPLSKLRLAKRGYARSLELIATSAACHFAAGYILSHFCRLACYVPRTREAAVERIHEELGIEFEAALLGGGDAWVGEVYVVSFKGPMPREDALRDEAALNVWPIHKAKGFEGIHSTHFIRDFLVASLGFSAGHRSDQREGLITSRIADRFIRDFNEGLRWHA